MDRASLSQSALDGQPASPGLTLRCTDNFAFADRAISGKHASAAKPAMKSRRFMFRFASSIDALVSCPPAALQITRDRAERDTQRQNNGRRKEEPRNHDAAGGG